MIPIIALEEHFECEAFYCPPGENWATDVFGSALKQKLRSLGEERLQDMRDGGIAMQIANDQLHQAVLNHPKSFAGFAVLPMADPLAAAEELTRCVKELKFVGALVSNHVNGQFYDGEQYHPFFERLEQLGVPLYIHPTSPTKSMMALYEGNYSEEAANILATFGWGWHSDAGLHILRLFLAGVFDKYPKLKIIAGHMGEMLPFSIDRFERVVTHFNLNIKRDIKTVWNENIWITTSGMFTLTPFAAAIRSVSVDRILYSVDYPFSKYKDGLKLIETLSKSDLVTHEELEMICYKNAEKLFGLSLEK
ncbi:2,3-dihydroxybenzoate decarboxylase [Smittium mucronatum]|uniref:2,3-dihydroxybenzoate decarboxylase n=1 Tax=Smittium mucronatum TaxID=133383 RepID=A0A1R0H2T0_9FUNG|nr:2,3-dihydroxybenzoate decarboxylase [Smittium mucronatum]